MITRIKGGRVIADKKIFDADVYYADGVILSVTDAVLPADEVIDAAGLYVSPGFIDMHTHGAVGHDFSSSTADEILEAVRFHMKHGTTTILPTFASCTMEEMTKGLIEVGKAMEKGGAPNILGTHLEGPYFSLQQAGAQDPTRITEPKEADYTELIRRFRKYIYRWSYAPERDTDQKFTKYLVAHGILPAVGHSDAIYSELKPAYEAGCKLVTHLYSGTSTITRDHGFRRLGVNECAYLWDDMDVEIIADGCHLPPELIQMIVKCKGVDRISLVTDSLKVAGTDAKESGVGSTKCIIEDGVCKLADRSAFAGSIATTDRLVYVVTKKAGIPLADAVFMAAQNPARVLGVKKGQLTPGYDADILFFDDDINVRTVIVGGQRVL